MLLQKILRGQARELTIRNTKWEPRLYETSKCFDREAARARRIPADARTVKTSNVKVGFKYEGWIQD